MAYRLGFVLEQTLGHVTHAQNLQHWVGRDKEVTPVWIPIPFHANDRWERAPVVRSNWTLRASLRAREQVHAALRVGRLDGLFFHTQLTALFAQRLMSQIPTVVSMDATPLNFDSIGRPYDHKPSGYQPIEELKNVLNRRSFNHACRVITWHDWGRRSLIRDYGVNPENVAVIPPGIDLERWHFPRDGSRSGPVRLLFVGGDFRRKGGENLLSVFRRDLAGTCELDIVTREAVDTRGLTQIRVHHNIDPNTTRLMQLFAEADAFVLPTFGDTLPIVIMEAMASGLPVVTTLVGAIAEEVEEGVTGLLVPPGDDDALAGALRRIVADSQFRRQMGAAARLAADRMFNGSTNYEKVLSLCKACVDSRR